MEPVPTELHFCHKWFIPNRCMTEPLSREAAALRHEQSKGYTVVVGDLKKPYCFLEASRRGVGFVSYFDDQCRPHILHDFKASEGRAGMLFLCSITHREYNSSTSIEVVSARSFHFSEDGKTKMMKSDVVKRLHSVTEARADVSDHFVKNAGFAEFGEFIRKREIKFLTPP